MTRWGPAGTADSADARVATVHRARRFAVVWTAAAGIVLAPFGAAAGDAPAAVPEGASCVVSGCHPDVLQHESLHPPVQAEACTLCHEQDGSRHAFTVADEPGLCTQCHAGQLPEKPAGQTVHVPAQYSCLACHDPHGTDTAPMLVRESVKDLCFTCHDEDDILAGRNKHAPAEWGLCTECHSPHSSPEPRMLLAKGRRLCGKCHDDIVEEAAGSEVQHDALMVEKDCLNCHSPHGSDQERLLKKPMPDLCLTCHSRRVKANDRTLIDMKTHLDRNPNWHLPVLVMGCPACHRPHGSANFRLLQEPFPPRFYARFSPDTYGLCFSCHGESLVTQQRTRTDTDFRDGDRNLHYVHVNREKGRTCRACHDVHASTHPSLIREVTRFGGWMMPLGFQPTENGGSCAPGCHPSRQYDRQHDRQ